MTVTLGLGKSVSVSGADASLSFDELVEDSRCPTGVTCIWAGDAVVRIGITAGGASSKHTLHTNSQFAREAEQSGVRVVLVSVTPYPTADAAPRRDDYRVTLSIERK